MAAERYYKSRTIVCTLEIVSETLARQFVKTRVVDLVRARPQVTCVQKAAARTIATASDLETTLGTARAEEARPG